MKDFIIKGFDILDIKYNKQHIEKIILFIKILQKWNRIYNLTSINDEKEIIIKHIFDSLSVIKYIDKNKILDVGSGAGFPGIPLAILLENRSFTLLDSSLKRINFLNYVKIRLGLNNVNIVQSRIEDFISNDNFDIIISRAFSSLDKFVEVTKNIFKQNSILLAMKGKLDKKEINDIKKIIKVYNIFVPFLEAERHLIKVENI